MIGLILYNDNKETAEAVLKKVIWPKLMNHKKGKASNKNLKSNLTYYFKIAINKILFDQGTKEIDAKMLEFRKSLLKRFVNSIATIYPEFLADKIDNNQFEMLIKKTGKVKYYMSILQAKILKNDEYSDPVRYTRQIIKVRMGYKNLTY